MKKNLSLKIIFLLLLIFLIILVSLNISSRKNSESCSQTVGDNSFSYLFFADTNDFNVYKIRVETGGITRIYYTEFPDSAKFAVKSNISNIKLFYKDDEIPIRCTLFEDSKGYLEFWADKKLCDENGGITYWLKFGEKPGLRISCIQGNDSTKLYSDLEYVKQTIHFEKNSLYKTSMPNRIYPHWIWKLIRKDVEIKFKLDEMNKQSQAQLRVFFYGAKNATHRVKIYLNNKYIDTCIWYHLEDFLFEKKFNTRILKSGLNKLKLEIEQSSRPDAIYLDWFEIDGEFVIDTTHKQVEVLPQLEGLVNLKVYCDKDQPVEIYQVESPQNVKYSLRQKKTENFIRFPLHLKRNSKLIVTSEQNINRNVQISHSTSKMFKWENDVQYLIITNKKFSKEVIRLAEYYNKNEMKTRIVIVEHIYDRCNDGEVSDHAIREFLYQAYQNYGQESTLHVLFVGDASYDRKDWLQGKQKNYIPTHLFNTPYNYLQTATDDWFITTRDGQLLPIALGRLPVQTNVELQNIVDKIIHYNTQANKSNKLMFISDVPFEDIQPDVITDQIIGNIDNDIFEINRGDVVSNHANISKLINNTLNNGVLVLNYVGHGGLTWLTRDKLYKIKDIEKLNNFQKLPFVILMTCLSGFFHDPEHKSLGEAFVLKKNGGAISCIAPTGFTDVYACENFLSRFYQLLQKHQDWTIGQLIIESKRQGIEEKELSLIDTNLLILLGDPAQRFPFLTL